MIIRHIAVLGCGQAGSHFVAGLAGRLPSSYRIDVHVASKESAARASSRVRAICKNGPIPRASTEFIVAQEISPDAELVFIQLPQQPAGLTREERNSTGQSAVNLFLRRALAKLNPRAVVLRYTAAFIRCESLNAVGNFGLFHYSNPANLLPLVEVGLPTEDVDLHRALHSCLSEAAYFPLIKRKWEQGFFSIRFQLRLLAAVEAIHAKGVKPEDDAPERLDQAIRMVVETLRTIYLKGVEDREILQTVKVQVERLLSRYPALSPLWKAFEETWNELGEVLSNREIATALLSGPALRCINPGFLRTVDIEGISPFASLMDRIFPEIEALRVETLMRRGRIGGAGLGYPPSGFYDWTAERRKTMMIDRDAFLAANCISLAAG